MERRSFLRGLLGLPAAVAAARALDGPEMTRGEEIVCDYDDLAGYETRVATGESPGWDDAVPVVAPGDIVQVAVDESIDPGCILYAGLDGRLLSAAHMDATMHPVGQALAKAPGVIPVRLLSPREIWRLKTRRMKA